MREDSFVQNNMVPTIVISNSLAKSLSNNILGTSIEDNSNNNQDSISPIKINEETIEKAIYNLINKKYLEESDNKLIQIVLYRYNRFNKVYLFFDTFNMEIHEKYLKFDKELKDYLILNRQYYNTLKFLENYLSLLKLEKLL